MVIEIFRETDEDGHRRDSDQESYESEEVFWDGEDDEGHEDWEMHIGRDDFWIQVICLKCMDDEYHDEDPEYYRETSIAIPDDNDRNAWEDGSEYRNEAKDEDNQAQGDQVGKGSSSDDESDEEEPDGCENTIDQGNDRLCLKYYSKAITHLLSEDCIFIIEEGEVPITHFLQEGLYLFPFDNKDIGEKKPEKKLQKYDPDIFDIFQGKLPCWFHIGLTEYTLRRFLKSEIQCCFLLDTDNEFLHLSSNNWSRLHEVSKIPTYSWDNIGEYENHDQDEDDIESSHDNVGCRIFGCDPVFRITFPMLSPIMYSRRDRFSRLQEYIGTDEDDEEEGEKIVEKVDDESEETIGYEFLEKLLWEDEGK